MDRRNRKTYYKANKGDMLTEYDEYTMDGSDLEENGNLATGAGLYPGDYKAF